MKGKKHHKGNSGGKYKSGSMKHGSSGMNQAFANRNTGRAKVPSNKA